MPFTLQETHLPMQQSFDNVSASAGPFTLSFGYLDPTNLTVQVVDSTTSVLSMVTFTTPSYGQILLNAPVTGSVIVTRKTPATPPAVVFSDPSALRMKDLNTALAQARYVSEEAAFAVTQGPASVGATVPVAQVQDDFLVAKTNGVGQITWTRQTKAATQAIIGLGSVPAGQNTGSAGFNFVLNNTVDGTYGLQTPAYTRGVLGVQPLPDPAGISGSFIRSNGTAYTGVDIPTAQSLLGLGSAAYLPAGTGANKVLQLDGSGRIPAIDGSLLTGVASPAFIRYSGFGAVSAFQARLTPVSAFSAAPSPTLFDFGNTFAAVTSGARLRIDPGTYLVMVEQAVQVTSGSGALTFQSFLQFYDDASTATITTDPAISPTKTSSQNFSFVRTGSNYVATFTWWASVRFTAAGASTPNKWLDLFLRSSDAALSMSGTSASGTGTSWGLENSVPFWRVTLYRING